MSEATGSAPEEALAAGGPRAGLLAGLALPVGAAAALVIGAAWHPLAPASVLLAGGLITAAAAGRDPFLLRVALASYVLRAVLAIGFQLLGGADVAALRPLVTAPVDGYRFWIFALDSPSYHAAGVNTMLAWRYGTELPAATGPEYFLLTGLVYSTLGPNPLNVVLWNALFGALTAILGYRMAEGVAGRAGARVAAVLIAFWPSTLIWSTQLLKDAICLFLTFAVLHLTTRCVAGAGEDRGQGLVRWSGRALLLFVAALFMYRFRNHVFLFLMPAPAILVAAGLLRREGRMLRRAGAAAVVVLLMMGAVSVGRRVDLDAIFGSRHPEIGHLNRGVALQSAGDLDGAVAEYHRALAIRPGYPPALRDLSSVWLARRNRPLVIHFLGEYVRRAPADVEARVALQASERGEFIPLSPRGARPAQQGLRLTGSHSDYVTGNRKYPLDDFVMAIAAARMGYTSSGGHSMIDPDVRFGGPGDIVRYVPRAVGNVLLAPYPWQWFDLGGSTGPFKALSAMEAVLLYALLVPLARGVRDVVRSRSPGGFYLLFFVASTGLLLGLVVSNLGTLFRLRLEVLLPLFTVAGSGLRAWRPACLRR